jgi:stalled ribosome alternative rescue factor ArfA
VMEAESQAVPNILTQHIFRMHLQNGRRAGNGAYARKETTSRVIVVSRPKVSFGLMDGLLYIANASKEKSVTKPAAPAHE